MAWKPIDVVTQEEMSVLRRESRRKARFLIDEDLDPMTADVLRQLGYNATTVAENGLHGHADTDIAAFARNHDRILLTADHGFFSERRFPAQAGPSVIVMPKDRLGGDRYSTALRYILDLFAHSAKLRDLTKVDLRNPDEITVVTRDVAAGRTDRSRYRFGGGDKVWCWENRVQAPASWPTAARREK